MNPINATAGDMKRLNAGSDFPDFLDDFRKFLIRTWELWKLGKDSKGQRGIIPIKPYPDMYVKDFLKFALVDGVSQKVFDCGHVNIDYPRAAEAHLIFFFILYRNRIDSPGTTGGNEGELCKEIKPVEIRMDPSPQKAKTIPSDSKNTQPPQPHKRAGREKRDFFDPLAGILY